MVTTIIIIIIIIIYLTYQNIPEMWHARHFIPQCSPGTLKMTKKRKWNSGNYARFHWKLQLFGRSPRIAWIVSCCRYLISRIPYPRVTCAQHLKTDMYCGVPSLCSPCSTQTNAFSAGIDWHLHREGQKTTAVVQTPTHTRTDTCLWQVHTHLHTHPHRRSLVSCGRRHLNNKQIKLIPHWAVKHN